MADRPIYPTLAAGCGNCKHWDHVRGAVGVCLKVENYHESMIENGRVTNPSGAPMLTTLDRALCGYWENAGASYPMSADG